MSRFFDKLTGKLHCIESYAGAVKVPKVIVHRSNRVRDEDSNGINSPTLRRQKAESDQLLHFFSKRNHAIIRGSFDVLHQTNSDLCEIATTLIYK
ncbi:MAG: peptidase [bacterium]|nr:peptidase [bacterium]